MPDTAARSAGVTRLSFDPVTETVSNPVAVAPAAGLGTDRPVASALGEDGSLYVGFPRSGAIVRISNPAGGSQSVQRIASTSDDRGVSGLAVAGPDLYLAEGAAVTRLASVAACTAAAPCAAVPTDISAPRRTRDHVRWPGRLYVSETPASTSSVLRYRIATGAEHGAIGNAVLADGRSVALQFATALGLDPAGNLYVGDDPTEGEQALQEHVWTAAVGTPFPAPRPVVDLAPSAGLAFGTVTVGQSVSQNATLANTGDAPLTIGGIAVSGAGAADFTIDGTACRSSLPAGWSCTTAVAFSPTAAGPRGAELVVTDDRGGSVPRAQRLALSGIGVARADTAGPTFTAPITAALVPGRSLSTASAVPVSIDLPRPPSQRPRLHQRARHRPHQARPPRLRHQRRRRLPPAVHRRHLGNRGALHTRPEPGRVAMTPSQEDPP